MRHHHPPHPPAVIPTVIRILTDHPASETIGSTERMVALKDMLRRLWNTNTPVAWQVIESGLKSGYPEIRSIMTLSLADGWCRGIDDIILTKGILPIYHTWKERLSQLPDTPSIQILHHLMVALRYGLPHAVSPTIRDIVIDATNRIQPNTPGSLITEYHGAGWKASDQPDRIMVCNPMATLNGIERWWASISSSS